MRRKERGKSQEDLAGCLSGGGMGLPDNGFRSVVRPNSATANGETVQYVFQMVEVEHLKYCNIHNVNFRHQMIYVQQQEIHQQCCSIAMRSVVRLQ